MEPHWNSLGLPDMCRVTTAQIAPMSSQTSILHRSLWGACFSGHSSNGHPQANCMHSSMGTGYAPACLHKLLPRHQRVNWRIPRMKDVSNLINICPTNPIQVLNSHEIFRGFCFCVSNDIVNTNIGDWCWYWGPTAKTGSIYIYISFILSHVTYNSGTIWKGWQTNTKSAGGKNRLSEKKVKKKQYKSLEAISRHCHVHKNISRYLRYGSNHGGAVTPQPSLTVFDSKTGYSRDKANRGKPKVDRSCPPLTANRISADCMENTPGPSIQHIPLGVYHTGCFKAILDR